LVWDFTKIDVVTVVVIGPTGWLTYKRRTNMCDFFHGLGKQSAAVFLMIGCPQIHLT
jgi:hypothetical protein